jgi:multiple sugar transport system substrate-binding protein
MDELASIAAEVMAKEGNPDLHGFLWQGKQAEVLVCDWVEFLGAAGGATLTDNEVTVNNAAGVKALQFMQDTIYNLKITPEAVLTYDEEPSRTPFTDGNGLFLRNWSYVWNISQDETQSKVKGLVGTQPLPAWPEGKSTATLGGYQFGLNASSKHPDEAWQLLNYLSGPEVQKSFALLGFAPTRPAIYEDAELAAENPFMVSLKDVFTGSTARPIHPAYPQMSLAIQSAISGALTNQTPAQEALDALAEELAAAM